MELQKSQGIQYRLKPPQRVPSAWKPPGPKDMHPSCKSKTNAEQKLTHPIKPQSMPSSHAPNAYASPSKRHTCRKTPYFAL